MARRRALPVGRLTLCSPYPHASLQGSGLAVGRSSVGGLAPHTRDTQFDPNDASYQIPACGLPHRTGVSTPRHGSRGARRAAVRRCRGCLRQGAMVRTHSRKVQRPIRRSVQWPGRHLRSGSQALHCAQERQEFSTGLWLQQQDLLERLLPPGLQGREISRRQVLTQIGQRASHAPFFRHIIAYKLPWSCFAAGAGLPARVGAR